MSRSTGPWSQRDSIGRGCRRWKASGQDTEKLPAGHRAQLMLAVRLHGGEAMYCPVPHVPQVVHAASQVTVRVGPGLYHGRSPDVGTWQ